MKTHLLLLAPASLALLSGAASAATEDQQLWIGGNTTVPIGGGFKISEEIVARFGNAQNGLYEIENNLLLGYQVSKTVSVWAGYTHDPQYSAGTFTRMEHRAREQVTFDNVTKFAGGQISLRARTEQRWREGLTGTGWRFRPWVRYVHPLSKDGKTQLIIWHESFINLNATGFQTTHGYDRMRNNFTVKFPISKLLSLEAGYLNQYQFGRGAQDKMDHVLTASVGFTF